MNLLAGSLSPKKSFSLECHKAKIQFIDPIFYMSILEANRKQNAELSNSPFKTCTLQQVNSKII